MIALVLLIGLLSYILFAWSLVRVVGWLADICAFTPVTTKVLQGLCAAFFVLLPTWDIIPSRLYFQHLCEKEAGVKVLKRVELDPSYFKPDGRPDDRKLLERYAQSIKHDPGFSSWTHITRMEGTIEDKQTGELLGTSTDFAYYGGWIGARIAPMSPVTCPAYKYGIFGMVLQEVFRPKQASLPGGN
jgi:hypothetical protein